MSDAKLQRDCATHRQSTDVRLWDRERIHEAAKILDRLLLRVRRCVVRYAGGRVAAIVIGDHAIPAREEANLVLPALPASGKLVAEDQRVATPALLIEDLDAV